MILKSILLVKSYVYKCCIRRIKKKIVEIKLSNSNVIWFCNVYKGNFKPIIEIKF